MIVFSKPGCPSRVFERLPRETEDALLLRARSVFNDNYGTAHIQLRSQLKRKRFAIRL